MDAGLLGSWMEIMIAWVSKLLVENSVFFYKKKNYSFILFSLVFGWKVKTIVFLHIAEIVSSQIDDF